MLRYALTLLLSAATTTTTTTATALGLDVSNSFTKPAQWTCLHTANITWGVVRAYHSYGSFDTNAPGTLAAAKSSGFNDMDVYLFPCASKSATSQAQDMVKKLSSSSWNSAWIDIETNPSTGCGWSTKDLTSNCHFLQEMIESLTATGTAVGIYSSHFEWNTVMGTNCTVANHLPLWYARYSLGPSCVDYSTLPFGGWSQPFAKQYADAGNSEASGCGFKTADMNVKC